eukprot:3126352-Amphidinium_carterae.1
MHCCGDSYDAQGMSGGCCPEWLHTCNRWPGSQAAHCWVKDCPKPGAVPNRVLLVDHPLKTFVCPELEAATARRLAA